MAKLSDLKVGMTIKIKKGKTPASRFGLDSEDVKNFVGKTTKIRDIDHHTLGYMKVQTNDETEYLWFPPDWIEIVEQTNEEKKETKTNTAIKQYVLFDQCSTKIEDYDISYPFDDINDIFNVADVNWGWGEDETIERFESGEMKLFEVNEVKIEIKKGKTTIQLKG